jgi:hypothetical protein
MNEFINIEIYDYSIGLYYDEKSYLVNHCIEFTIEVNLFYEKNYIFSGSYLFLIKLFQNNKTFNYENFYHKKLNFYTD